MYGCTGVLILTTLPKSRWQWCLLAWLARILRKGHPSSSDRRDTEAKFGEALVLASA